MKIISIMPVWDEQNMIALSLYSSKNFITEYIIILQKGIDKTKEFKREDGYKCGIGTI